MATFGKTDVGAVHGHPGGGNIRGSKHTLGEDGTVTKISWYGDDNGLGGNCKCAIYDDTGAGGDAGALKVESEENVVSNVLEWQHFDVNPGVPLTAGDYWIVMFHQNQVSFLRDEPGTGMGKAVAYDGFPDPLGVQTDEARDWSIYATYTPSVGLSIPVAMHHYGHHISKIIRG